MSPRAPSAPSSPRQRSPRRAASAAPGRCCRLNRGAGGAGEDAGGLTGSRTENGPLSSNTAGAQVTEAGLTIHADGHRGRSLGGGRQGFTPGAVVGSLGARAPPQAVAVADEMDRVVGVPSTHARRGEVLAEATVAALPSVLLAEVHLRRHHKPSRHQANAAAICQRASHQEGTKATTATGRVASSYPPCRRVARRRARMPCREATRTAMARRPALGRSRWPSSAPPPSTRSARRHNSELGSQRRG